VYTNSIVEYGLTPRYGEWTSTGDSYGLGHRVTLTGLRHGKKYHYRVMARDVWGNMAYSGDHELDTTLDTGDEKRAEVDKGVPVFEDGSVVRTEDGLFVFSGSASKPSKVILKLQELRKEKDKEHGLGFLSEEYSKIDVCVKCHHQGISHPVGVSASGPDVKTPEGLPTLPGGIITCVTCHFPHGGEKQYFARMDFMRDLCIKCHIKDVFL
jgi:predicted CXXCH cytochrome family protein